MDDSLNFAFLSQNFTMTDTLLTFEPYLQYALQLPYGLTVTPGVKYVSFNRQIDSPMNQGSGDAGGLRPYLDEGVALAHGA